MTKSKRRRGRQGLGSDANAAKTVLVTGAQGCVGRFLVDLLVSRGYRVRATDRSLPAKPEPDSVGTDEVEWIEADLTSPGVPERLVEGTWAVIHTAAWVDISVAFDVQAPINLHAVEALHEAASKHGVQRFIHFSTGSLYGPKKGPVVESDPLVPTSGYELAKLLAEDYLMKQQPGPLVTILRPALIYGPRGKVLVAPLATLPVLVEPLSGLVPHLVGGPRNNLVHGLDAARAALHLLEHPQPHLSVFNVAAPDARSLGEYVEIVMSEGGIELAPLRLPFPDKVVDAALPLLTYKRPFRWVNQGASWLWKRMIVRHKLEPRLSPRVDPEAIPYLAGDTIFDSTALLETGFSFTFPDFASGWGDTVAWYRAQGWLPGIASQRRASQRDPAFEQIPRGVS